MFFSENECALKKINSNRRVEREREREKIVDKSQRRRIDLRR